MYQKFGLIEPYEKYTRSEVIDEGRFVATKDESDKYVFKVPVLRNVAKTPPYFHDGSVDDLMQAQWIMGKVRVFRRERQVQLDPVEYQQCTIYTPLTNSLLDCSLTRGTCLRSVGFASMKSKVWR